MKYTKPGLSPKPGRANGQRWKIKKPAVKALCLAFACLLILMGSGRPAEELLPELANEAVAGGSTDDRSVVMLEWEERGE